MIELVRGLNGHQFVVRQAAQRVLAQPAVRQPRGEIDALGLDLLEVRQLMPDAD